MLTTETDTGSGGRTHKFFRYPKSAEDCVGDLGAIAQWARLTYGWLGRSPDYKAAFLATLGANSDFYEPYQENAKRWYREAQERVLYWNHAIIHPPVDRNRPPDEVGDVFMHVEEERDDGLVVSGAKVVATGSALTHFNFIAHYGPVPLQKKEFAIVCAVAMGTPGVKLICRPSYEMVAEVMGSPFDYPLSSRLDENDAIFIFDKVLVPWENVFVYGDIEKANNFFPLHGLHPAVLLPRLHPPGGQARFHRRAADEGGRGDRDQGLPRRAGAGGRGARVAQHAVGPGERDGARPQPWKQGAVLPNMDYAMAYRLFSTIGYPRVKEIVEQTVSSGLIYINSNARDFKNPEIRKYCLVAHAQAEQKAPGICAWVMAWCSAAISAAGCVQTLTMPVATTTRRVSSQQALDVLGQPSWAAAGNQIGRRTRGLRAPPPRRGSPPARRCAACRSRPQSNPDP